jgi:hypothetical protein
MRLADRQIGVAGTGARVALGVAMVALPVTTSGVGRLDLAAAFIALPLIAGIAGRLPGLLALPVVIASGVGLTFLTPLDGGTALWLFFGVSMLVAAAKGYVGCEVLAIPNLVRGRNDAVGCPVLTPVDAVEASRRRTNGV